MNRLPASTRSPARSSGISIDSIRQRQPEMSVLVATAYMEEAERFDWLVAMNAGEILATGSAAALKKTDRQPDTGTGIYRPAAGSAAPGA